jgi:hypothetical protein
MSEYAKLRVALVGNCQVPGLVASLNALLPGAVVDGWHLRGRVDDAAARLRGYDVVMACPEEDCNALFSRSWLLDHCRNVVFLVPVVFGAFHPDTVLISDRGQIVDGPLEHYHSIIVAAAYSLGLGRERVPRLFNSLTYSRLGYFDGFTTAKAIFLQQHLDAGFDLREHFQNWMLAGAFMHSANHPRIEVLSALATLAAARAGLVDYHTSAPVGVYDYLADTVRWPVYPEIARRIGIPGSLTFWRRTKWIPSEKAGAYIAAPGRELDLVELVASMYQFYSRMPDLNFDSPYVTAAREQLQTLLL